MDDRQNQKEVILLVHGFGSSHKCWYTLIDLLRKDERICYRYDIATWDYPTKWLNMNILGRIPRLKEIGNALGHELESPYYRNRKLTLVGHSQGGLVIQSCFARLLEAGNASSLKCIRQAVFIATPNKGSTTANTFRRLASTLIKNPQELTLRVLNPDVSDLRNTIYKRIVSATNDTNIEYRIPIYAICAMEDNIVPEASARGSFDNIISVPGNHFSVLTPKNHQDKRYTGLADLLLNPGGHRHRFEIESYEHIIRVEPVEKQIIMTKSTNTRNVEYDNYATIRRRVSFASSNRCRQKFSMRYGTRSDGYIIAHMSHKNEAPANQIGLGEDYGTYCQFDFTPENGEEYSLKVEIYKGFDEGNRNVHFHHLNVSHYRKLRYAVDLTGYITAGYEITEEPVLYLYPKDIEHSEFCSNRKLGKPVLPVSSDPQGKYEWELQDINEGVVDIKWDVNKRTSLETMFAHEPET